MRKYMYAFLIFVLLILLGSLFFVLLKGITPRNYAEKSSSTGEIEMIGTKIQLPETSKKGGLSLNEALAMRRSTRVFSNESLPLDQLSQLLWSAQGITSKEGLRTAPSAGETFPLEIFVMINRVPGISKGIFYFNPIDATLESVLEQDVSAQLVKATRGQAMISDAAVVIIFGAIPERTISQYGERGLRYVYNEIGHASQNVHLQAAALGLGTVVVGSYSDEEVEKLLQLDTDIKIMYLMPVGMVN
jgi:SagB-type dehydrogenase family enzyme